MELEVLTEVKLLRPIKNGYKCSKENRLNKMRGKPQLKAYLLETSNSKLTGELRMVPKSMIKQSKSKRGIIIKTQKKHNRLKYMRQELSTSNYP